MAIFSFPCRNINVFKWKHKCKHIGYNYIHLYNKYKFLIKNFISLYFFSLLKIFKLPYKNNEYGYKKYCSEYLYSYYNRYYTKKLIMYTITGQNK